MEEDIEAALEWQDYQKTLCTGCGLPKVETFAPPPADWPHPVGKWEERYDVDVLQCDACAATQRKAYKRNAAREMGMSPPFGEYYAVHEHE